MLNVTTYVYSNCNYLPGKLKHHSNAHRIIDESEMPSSVVKHSTTSSEGVEGISSDGTIRETLTSAQPELPAAAIVRDSGQANVVDSEPTINTIHVELLTTRPLEFPS